MSRRKKTLQPRWKEPEPDCCTCVLRSECEVAEEGTFCTRWRGSEPAPAGPDPNEEWRRGNGEAPEA